MTERHDQPRRQVHPALVLAVLAMASFIAALDLFVVNVGLPEIGRGVGSDDLSNLSWVLTGYAIIYAALLVPAGRLADRFGRKPGFMLGLGIFTAASLGAALSSNVWVLVFFRCLQAAGAAALTPTSLGLVLTSAPVEKVETYVKIWFTTGALSATLGPVIGGILLSCPGAGSSSSTCRSASPRSPRRPPSSPTAAKRATPRSPTCSAACS
jgi:MFS family permease